MVAEYTVDTISYYLEAEQNMFLSHVGIVIIVVDFLGC